MARKKNKKQKKQRIEQRRGKIVKKRSKRRSSAIPPSPVSPPQPSTEAIYDQELIEDLKPILPYHKQQDTTLEEMLRIVITTTNLSQEPEFEDVLFNPLDAVKLFIATAEDIGVGPEILRKTDSQEMIEAQGRVLNECLSVLLTDEMHQTILDRLSQLRRRAKANQAPELAAQAAVVQSILQDRQYRPMWLEVGLIRAILLESFNIGFDVMVILFSKEADKEAAPFDSRSLQHQFTNPKHSQKIKSLLAKHPKLNKYLDFQINDLWETVNMALMDGELELYLFTDAELEQFLPIYEEMLMTLETVPEDKFAERKKYLEQFVNQIKERLSLLLTPERVANIKQDIERPELENQMPQAQLAPFLLLKKIAANPETTVDELHPTLMKVLMNQLDKKYLAVHQEDN